MGLSVSSATTSIWPEQSWSSAGESREDPGAAPVSTGVPVIAVLQKNGRLAVHF